MVFLFLSRDYSIISIDREGGFFPCSDSTFVFFKRRERGFERRINFEFLNSE